MSEKIENILEWKFEDKIKYLNEYKDFLYEIWYQKIKAADAKDHLEVNKLTQHNFYLAFSSFAKNILRINFDEYVSEIVNYQKQVEKEFERVRFNTKELKSLCQNHSSNLQEEAHQVLSNAKIRNNYLKSRLIEFRNIYIAPTTNVNRMTDIKAGFKGECWLIAGQNQAFASEKDIDTFIQFWFTQINEILPPIYSFKLQIEKENNKPEVQVKKYVVYFKDAEQNNPSLAEFKDNYYELCQKINFLSHIYEDSIFKYKKDYPRFRKASKTLTQLYLKSNKIPQELVPYVEKYTNNRYEKLEAYKHSAHPTVAPQIISARESYEEFMYNEIEQLNDIKRKELTPKFKLDFMDLIDIEAKYVYPIDLYEDYSKILVKRIEDKFPKSEIFAR